MSQKFIVFFLVLSCTSAGFAANEKYASPLSIIAAKDGKILYVVLATGRGVSFINTTDGNIIETVNLSEQLSGMAISPDGKTLYVTGGDFNGKVFIIDINTIRLTNTLNAGHCPTAPAVRIDEYLKSLKPLPSPYLVKSRLTGKPKLSKAAMKGKKYSKKPAAYHVTQDQCLQT